MRRRWHVSTILAFWFAGLAASQTAPVSFEGQRIINIYFDPPQQPLEPLEIFEILPIHRDDQYHAEAIRQSIERLYATGRFEDIQVDASAAPGGVNLRFITKNSWFIGHVAVEWGKPEPPTDGQIVNASRLNLGVAFDPDQLTAAEDGIRRLLTANGYFQPAVSHHLDYDNHYQQALITFVIDVHKRTHYSTPVVSGDNNVLTTEQITAATHWRRFLFLPGFRGITQNRTRSGLDNVRLKYENSDRLLASVSLDGIDEKNGAAHIIVKPGPTVEVKAEGAKVSHKTLKQRVPVFEEHTVDEDLLVEGATNLRNYFQSKGYFEAVVDYQQTGTNGKTVVNYRITPGERHKLVRVGIEGNKYFNEKTIRERLYVVPKSIEFRRGRYSEATRHRDEQTITDLYLSNGFRDVKVTSRTDDDYKGKEGDFAVTFNISEGPQYTVSFLRIDGAKKLDLSTTIESLSSQAGQAFSEFNVAADRETILQAYGSNGFPNATFEWTSRVDTVAHKVEVTFVINEGEQQFVRQVIATGLTTTRPTLVNRQIELNPGDPLSPSTMADTQRRLYDLGVFAQVNMAIQNPDGDERRKNIIYDIEEARRYSISAGFGAEFARIGGSNAVTDLSSPGGGAGLSPRVSFDASRLNFLGTGQTISFHSRLSTLQKRGSISYFVPRAFRWQKIDATYSILYDDTHDVRTFQARRAEASAQFAHHYSKASTFFYRFNYRDVNVSNLKIDPLLLPRLAQSVRVGVASMNWVQDRRDDPTDPHKGIYNTLDAGVATRIFGSQTSFIRLLGRNATYYRIGTKYVFARETQFGFQPAFQIPAGADPLDPIPLPERFFGGGGDTHRGFPDNQAGPRDLLTGFPLGGSALLFNSTEFRFPVFGANISGVLFEDAGNVYTNLRSISFRVKQKDPTDFNYMVHAAGFGIRYRTPVGPIRVDLAYSINPPKYNGFPGSYVQLVQCSAAGTCQASQQQISHFQFFFSIGQAF